MIPETKINFINLLFIVNGEYKIILPSKLKEPLNSVINRYINKTNDLNINFFKFNGNRFNELYTVFRQGLTDGSEIYVVRANNILGD